MSNRSQLMSNVYTEDCKFIPRGFTHPDCIRLCMNESGSNGCGYNQCDASCQLCEDQNRCRWLLDEELFRKNNQACRLKILLSMKTWWEQTANEKSRNRQKRPGGG